MNKNLVITQSVKDSTVYESPMCDNYNLESEGVLCSSLENPDDLPY